MLSCPLFCFDNLNIIFFFQGLAGEARKWRDIGFRGNYALSVNSTEVGTGSLFSYFESTSFGACPNYGCPEGFTHFELELTTAEGAPYTIWSLEYEGAPEFLSSVGPYNDNIVNYEGPICVPVSTCAVFRIKTNYEFRLDWNAAVWLNGTEAFRTKGEFTSVYAFGNCCEESICEEDESAVSAQLAWPTSNTHVSRTGPSFSNVAQRTSLFTNDFPLL